jgi:Na+-transporting methylmalonyl-CoA/oxaloacetate decarboxylase gamma subunit
MRMLSKLNLGFTVIFTAEAIIKLVGLGFKEFNKERFNQFDLVVVIISIAEMQFQNQEGPGVFSSFRAFRLFKIFRLFRVGDLRILLDSIQFTLTTIGDYVILLLLFIYVFALIGMSFFAGQLKFDDDDKVDHENGESPRTNFDNLGWAIITIFQVLLGEGWNEIMYRTMRSVNKFWAVYYIVLVIFGNIIMLNLFLAILLGNFDKARMYGQKKKIFEAFKEIMERKSLNEALDIILGDMSIHVKTKVLKWD